MTVDDLTRFDLEKVGPGIVNAPAILHLNPHRQYFGEIVARTKRSEYRDYTPYWRRRIENRKYDFIHFRNGYAAKAPDSEGRRLERFN